MWQTAVFLGVGMRIITPVPNILELKFDLTVMEASTLERPISFTIGKILKGKLMFSVVRYLGSDQTKLCV